MGASVTNSHSGLVSGGWAKAWAEPELPVYLFLVLLFGLLLQRESILLSDPDVGWLLRSGELIWEKWALPEADVFSFTQSGKHWFHYQWGFEVYLWGLHKIAGLGGAIWGGAVLVALTYSLLLYFLLSLRTNRLLSLGLTILAALATGHYWYARPGTATFLLYLLVLILLENYRRSPGRQLWALPALFILWANVHVGFVIGLMAVFVYGLWAWVLPADFRGVGVPRDTHILRVFPLCILALMLNPHGIYLLPYVHHLIFGIPFFWDNIGEGQSPNFHKPILLFFFFQIILVLYLEKGGYPARKLFLTLLTITLGMALYSVRHLPFFSLTATMVLAYLLVYCYGYKTADPIPQLGRGWGWGAVGIAFSLLLMAGVNQLKPVFYTFNSKRVPLGAVAFLKSYADKTRPIRVFSENSQWSNYLIYALYPGVRVFLDTRYDFYGENFVKAAIKLMNQARHNPQVLNSWGVDFLVLIKNELAPTPEAKPDWVLAYEDKESIIYQHLPGKELDASLRSKKRQEAEPHP